MSLKHCIAGGVMLMISGICAAGPIPPNHSTFTGASITILTICNTPRIIVVHTPFNESVTINVNGEITPEQISALKTTAAFMQENNISKVTTELSNFIDHMCM